MWHNDSQLWHYPATTIAGSHLRTLMAHCTAISWQVEMCCAFWCREDHTIYMRFPFLCHLIRGDATVQSIRHIYPLGLSWRTVSVTVYKLLQEVTLHFDPLVDHLYFFHFKQRHWRPAGMLSCSQLSAKVESYYTSFSCRIYLYLLSPFSVKLKVKGLLDSQSQGDCQSDCQGLQRCPNINIQTIPTSFTNDVDAMTPTEYILLHALISLYDSIMQIYWLNVMLLNSELVATKETGIGGDQY